MGKSTRVAPQPFTVTIPANHPALFCLGGQAFHEAASDLVDRTRKAAAIALVEDPETRVLIERYHAALSTAWGPGELLNELRARGVTELHGTDYGDPGKPLSTLLRACADEIDRAETDRRPTVIASEVSARDVAPVTHAERSPRKPKALSPEEMRRQPRLKLPIKGGKQQASLAKSSDLHIADAPPYSARQRARN